MAAPQPSPWAPPQGQNEPDPEGRGGCFWTAVFLGAVLVIVMVMIVSFPQVTGADFDWARLTYLTLLLMFVALGMGGALRANIGRTVRHISIWMGVAAGIAILFAFREEFGFIKDRVVANVTPRQGIEDVDRRAISFYASEDGHYYIEAEVEGRAILFLVDTGASDVVLTKADAERLRYEPEHLDYTRLYNTANGTVRGAPIVLEGIGIGSIYVRNVPASVNDGEMNISLLGMSFLRELDGFEISSDKLTLRQ